MNVQQGYPGIDRFRMIAALLVITIHTSPLLSLGTLPNFILARVLARVAVPFFLAATGFFLLSFPAEGIRPKAMPVLRFVRKTALVYGISILLYLPVNIYAGHLHTIRSFGDILKWVLVDGTMYHLWYLPASIAGVLLVWLLLRYTGFKTATLMAAVLYGIGLLGDSYFGFTATIPEINSLYQSIFTLCAYTRNGLFYAPIFLLTGVWAAKCQPRPRAKSGICLCASLLLLLVEGLLLYAADFQQHDSMYILLPVCVFFLLTWLSSFKGTSNKALRDISLLAYVIHPWAIVLLRGAAKLLRMELWLVDNSVIHFVAVCAISFAAAYVLVRLKAKLPKQKAGQTTLQRAWLEIDLKALEHNVRTLESLLPAGCKLMPAIKANAYGFGAVPIARALYRMGVTDYCVASLSEGIVLRKQGIRGNILILGYTHPDDCHLVKRYRLIQTVVDYAHGTQLAKTGIRLQVHIKVDTGMRRLGERSDHVDKLTEIFSLRGLNISGIFTQLSCCDSASPNDIEYTKMQLANFNAVLEQLKKQAVVLPKVHIQCSYGIINYPSVHADYARPGLALYGILDEACCIGEAPSLKPIFTVRARIALVKPVYRGEHIGYGSMSVADEDMRIAVVTMGYADGLPRSLSAGIGRVLIRGHYAPYVGNICMDQALVDVSRIADTIEGDTAVVIGQCGNEEISINEFAKWVDTVPNEIVSRFGERVERRYY